jgi:hypothetical protein
MKKLLLILFISSSLFLSSCHRFDEQKLTNISTGMAKEEALKLIGFEPYDIDYQNWGNSKEEKYHFSYFNNDGRKKGLMIEFENNKVTTFYTY